MSRHKRIAVGFNLVTNIKGFASFLSKLPENTKLYNIYQLEDNAGYMLWLENPLFPETSNHWEIPCSGQIKSNHDGTASYVGDPDMTFTFEVK